MANDDKSIPPPWFKVEYVALVVQVAVVLGGLSIWLIGNASRTDQTAAAMVLVKEQTTAAMVTVNSRLDRIFEKLDSLPVVIEKVRQAEIAISESKGGYATLDTRLRAIENNLAVTHEELVAKRPRSN